MVKYLILASQSIQSIKHNTVLKRNIKNFTVHLSTHTNEQKIWGSYTLFVQKYFIEYTWKNSCYKIFVLIFKFTKQSI